MERIKAAISRAKLARGEAPPPPGAAGLSAPAVRTGGDLWSRLREVPLDEDHLINNRVVTFSKDDPAHVPFDILRTKIMRLLETNGWSTIAVTSPTQACGKTMIATNLAFSFARQRATRAVLADVDLKRPQLRKVLGFDAELSMGDYLMGGIAPEDFFLRVGENLAVGATQQSFRHSAELLQHPDA
ncbi:MAG: exopolysaccharide biosynthesis protein, partial [Pseudomonadota bacterium]